MTKVRRAMAVLGVATLLLSACSSDDSGGDDGSAESAAATDSGDDSTASDEPASEQPTSDDDESGDVSGGEIDNPLPIPLPPGEGEVILTTQTDLLVNYNADEFDRLVQFYDDWTSGEADAYERVVLPNGAVSWEYASGGIRAIIVAPDAPGSAGPAASVTILVAP